LSVVGEVLFPYQVEAAERIAADKCLLLADQPGLGKTLEVFGGLELAGLFDRPSAILIVSPIVNAQTTWVDTIERFVRKYHDVVLVNVSKGTASQKAKAFVSGVRESVDTGKPTIFLANHNAIDWVKTSHRVAGFDQIRFDAVVIDESHMVLPIRVGGGLTNFWRGLLRLRMPDGCLRVAVSGTPDRGKLENRFGTWRFLFPDSVGSDLWVWLADWFFIVDQRVSKSRVVKAVAGLRKEQAWLQLDGMRMLRRTKAEVLPELPPKRYVDVEVELCAKQKANYFGAQMVYEEQLRGGDESGAMVFALRSRQLATCSWDEAWTPVVGGVSAKRDWLLGWLAERGFIEFDVMSDADAKVVVVSQFSKVLGWLRQELALVGVRCEVLDGSASATKRAAIQDEFQNGALRVVLLSGSMGVGINLDRADDLILLDVPYDPDRVEQIEDRVHRASSNHHVTIWNVAAVDTIDQVILEQVSKRYKVTRELLDGSRGVEFARKVLAIVRKGDVVAAE
jgi:SNF2 family DNA or RNA helicase